MRFHTQCLQPDWNDICDHQGWLQILGETRGDYIHKHFLKMNRVQMLLNSSILSVMPYTVTNWFVISFITIFHVKIGNCLIFHCFKSRAVPVPGVRSALQFYTTRCIAIVD